MDFKKGSEQTKGFPYEKRKDVVVIDSHLVRLDKPPKHTRPRPLIKVKKTEIE